jgi:hypothetical protein
MTYHLRRLRLHGLIARVPKTHRYQLTDPGWRMILFSTRCYNRLLRPGLTEIIPAQAQSDSNLRHRFDQLDAAITEWFDHQKVAAKT